MYINETIQNTVQTIKNIVNTNTHITKTPTQFSKHPHIHWHTHYEGVLISTWPEQEGKKLQRPNSGYIQHTPNEAVDPNYTGWFMTCGHYCRILLLLLLLSFHSVAVVLKLITNKNKYT